MKARALFNVACVLVFSTAVGFRFQQTAPQDPAEKHYKNIQIFNGVEAKEVRPAMDAFSSALGVRCSFCHTQDAKGEFQWASDDKEEKKTAREMYRMMKKINDDNFDGRMEVTCATCHQGNSSPNRIPPIGQPPREARRPGGGNDANMPTADSLVDKYVAAIGGQAAVDKVTSMHIKSEATAEFGHLTLETFAKSPDKVTNYVQFPQGLFTQTYDGKEGWQKFGNDSEQVQGLDLANLIDSSPLMYVHVKEGYSGFRRVRKDTLDGKDVYVVDAQPKAEGLRVRLYFDASTGLLSRVWTGQQTLAGLVPATEDYSDYQEVNGVKIPHTIVDTGTDGVRTFKLLEIKINEDIPDSKFAKP